ncbi:AIPR family protein [Erythrobacter sp. NFXS35]|uniref:AIPR family protein n=1 Tax=Erythrobacter sp. NFXS35 TaxID=2818436 RepID=UPI0032DF3D88
MDDLDAAFEELREDVMLEAEASGLFQEEAFFEIYAEAASENGDTIDLEYAHCRKEGGSKPYRVDGHAFDADRGTLYLAVCDFREGRALQSLQAARMDSALRQATNFFENALAPEFINSLEDSSQCFSAAYPVYMNQQSIRRLRVILFSNARLAARRPPLLMADVAGVPVVYTVLDLSRYAEIQKSRSAPEAIEVDLESIVGDALPCLRASTTSGDHESYLLALPGDILADVYGLYGARLLEQNVRTYLQARTKVNQGILKTIREEPEMFFAYNNGLTATASGVELKQLNDGQLGISSIRDLQIVNGGQTTASILYAKDIGKSPLDKIHVQMKLSVIPPDSVETVVPRISRWANTQNRISEADFFSNHPFHLQMERYSRVLAAPPKDGALIGEKWFYERARGQYRDGMAYASKAERRKYQLEFPQAKVMVKTDLAKYVVTFECRPDIVSKGAQKCFMHFATETTKSWKAAQAEYNEIWFKKACSMAFLFRWTDKMIGQSDWYQEDRGYKSQTVTYTLSWLAHHVKQLGRATINWDAIWSTQDVPEELQEFLEQLAPQIAAAIKDAPAAVRNVGEYCKMQACWENISKSKLRVPSLPDHITLDEFEAKNIKKSGRDTKRIDTEIDLDVVLFSIVPKADLVRASADQRRILSDKSNRALQKLAAGNLTLSRAERNAMKLLINRLADEGAPVESMG